MDQSQILLKILYPKFESKINCCWKSYLLTAKPDKVLPVINMKELEQNFK